MKKTKVLVIGSSTPHIRNHVNRIRDNFDIHMISNNGEFIPEGIPYDVVDFSIRKVSNLVITPRKIRKIIERVQPDVVHVHQANSYAWYTVLGNKKNKLPLVLTLWGSDILLQPKEGLLNKWMTQFVLKHADVITSDSVFLADEAQKLVPAQKLQVRIANFGVEKIDVPIEKEKIIYSNRNHASLYRINEIILAFHRFLESGQRDWKLVIAGRGSETEALKQLVNSLNINQYVDFVGFVNLEQNAANYAKATYFVSIPSSDATAMSLLEAMYYQCVPIVSDLPANHEWVKHNENGLIVQDLESNFFQQALSLDCQAAGAQNRAIILEKATVEVSKREFSDIVYQALKRKSS